MLLGPVGLPKSDFVTMGLVMSLPLLLAPRLVAKFTASDKPFNLFMYGVIPRLCIGLASGDVVAWNGWLLIGPWTVLMRLGLLFASAPAPLAWEHPSVSLFSVCQFVKFGNAGEDPYVFTSNSLFFGPVNNQLNLIFSCRLDGFTWYFISSALRKFSSVKQCFVVKWVSCYQSATLLRNRLKCNFSGFFSRISDPRIGGKFHALTK